MIVTKNEWDAENPGQPFLLAALSHIQFVMKKSDSELRELAAQAVEDARDAVMKLTEENNSS